MKRKSFLALAMVMALAGAASTATTITAQAASLTQAVAPSQVTYGTVTASQKEMLHKLFDAQFYAENNQDVVDVLGADSEVLFEHFIKCGIWEGRKGWADFDPAAYASAYPDLRAAFGDDIISYYVHYINHAAADGRTLTTVEACIEAGISVTPFFDESELLTAQVYYAANLLGTTDYAKVQQAISTASSSGGSVVVNNSSSGESYVIAPSYIDNTASGYEKIGSLEVGELGQISIYKTTSGYEVVGKDQEPTGTIVKPVGVIAVGVESVAEVNEDMTSDDEFTVEGLPSEGNFVITDGFEINNTYSAGGEIHGSDPAGTNESTVTVTEDEQTATYNLGSDTAGTEESEYEYGTVVKDNDDGSVSVTVVVTNDDTGFVHNETYTFSDTEE